MTGRSVPPSFHHRDFDATTLLSHKHGRTIAAVIPARNESATVAGVVEAALAAGGGELVDEVLVVDGGSGDDTAVVAAAAGAKVVHQDDVLAEVATGGGKGAALWKGLAATTGDLVAFLDADVLDPHPRFVTGLVGPIVVEPGIRLVKATYDRPLRTDGGAQPGGGGRVTELLARPLLSAFWPELAWLAQPLAGEYAGERTLLESVPFASGYGVELGLLADVAARFGAGVIAQVDLEQRLHRHQPLDALGRMAAEILHVAMNRLGAQDRVSLAQELVPLLPQPVRDPKGALAWHEHTVAWRDLPPLADVRRLT